MKLSRIAGAGSVVLALGISGLWSARAAADPGTTRLPGACAALAAMPFPGSDMRISRAARVAAAPAGTVPSGFGPAKVPVAVPAYCRVEGVIDAHTGTDGKHYGLTFALALPDDWAGRFLFQGGGGLNGTLNPPLGGQAAGDRPALARGFAVVSTDGGHRGAGFDASFQVDQQASLDFAFNAVPTVAVAAKRLIAAYYGKSATRSYFDGCSTGGRESMEAAERYPSLFDGILTGAPAMRTDYSNLGLKWAAVAFNRIAPKNPTTGQPIPGGAFSAQDGKLIVNSLLQACDGLDGMKDGMIFNVGACHFDPVVLACHGPKAPGCLSEAQIDALHAAFGGPIDARGRRYYASHPYDTGIAGKPPVMFPAGFLLTSTAGPVSGGQLPVSMDLQAAEAAAEANAEQQLIDTDRWTNLSTFFARGGKQIFYHGMSDPWFSAFDTLDYYQRLGRDNGGAEKVQGSARLFLVPGMGHCQGGPATLDHFDLLTALVDWVERGKAPESVIATGRSLPGRSRPLCAWPLHAQYSGHGDPNQAASFQCRR